MSGLTSSRLWYRRIILISTISSLILINQFVFSFQPALATSNLIMSAKRQIQSRTVSESQHHSAAFSLPDLSINRPIIFVHGLNQNASNMGVTDFVPIYAELQKLFGKIQTFNYVDDRAFGQGTAFNCPANYKYSQYHYSQCLSQSHVLENASELDKNITDLYNSAHRKVTLIGYSMGAAIIRTSLAGCPQNVTCQWELGSNIAQMVDNVFFLNGVQQGSWFLQHPNALNKEPAIVSVLNTPGLRTGLTQYIQHFMDINTNRPAERDLTPLSGNIQVHNSVLPPGKIHYFNFYGDIHFSLQTNILGWHLKTNLLDGGDLVLLPGTDDPKDTPYWGGARFCYQCSNQNYSNPDMGTSYQEWPLTIDRQIDVTSLLTCSTGGTLALHLCVLKSLFDTFLKPLPQMHTNIPSTASLDGTDIQVQDTTGMSGSKMTSIADEIALQLQVMPPTQTSCPAPGTARSAIMIPFAAGNHQNLVYTYNVGTFHSGPQNAAISGILKRYDATTGKKTEIINLPKVSISQAQISTDGQWILFISQVSGNSAIQLVRMDGEGLQTLYCSQPSMQVAAISWSSDQKSLAFSEEKTSDFMGLLSPIYVLNTSNGTLQTYFIQPLNIENPPDPHEVHISEYQIEGWLDNTRIYMSNVQAQFSISLHRTDIYLLDTTKGTNQTPQDLQRITNLNVLTSYGLDFSSSIDRTQLFVSNCYGCGQGGSLGPSSILIFPATGGPPKTIFNNSAFAITAIRVISPTTLLLNNDNLNATDPNQNGIWKINTDGSGLTQLSSNGSDIYNSSIFQGEPSLCIGGACMRPPWTNSSRDGHMFAAQTDSITQNSQTVFIGSLNGGIPLSIATASDDSGELYVVGWTAI